uniref:Uncharacterized protein n=1 Tax=Anguilla anguilla TaxID=7936 RepID=A0A0E9XVB1_ANGAN
MVPCERCIQVPVPPREQLTSGEHHCHPDC